ncbi:SURF1 family protein [Wenzhouxiangella sp. XN201]|uniref:SURF1 family protein n=1 Tax=Wenzhouxiangella sp. XN201 TaxID=2710755 RepID=UPI0013CA32BD|nr:SURF1 family protein [Wenzhouxiangella sp. XN201]NEZ04034.1 SURF1 family protein [Wenzhouxiangella sp. XN201]
MRALRSLSVRLLPHLAAAGVILLCVHLANWQFDRAAYKRDLVEGWEQAPALALETAASQAQEGPIQVDARGRFDNQRLILLDNQVRAGQAGVHVYTPFMPGGQDKTWLVNRGWHALPDRSAGLPAIETPGDTMSITGRLVDAPRVGRQLGEARALDAEDWPQLVTYLDLERVAEALGHGLGDRVILLDPEHPAHLTGDPWRPVVFGPDRHRAYAWQWITMAVVVFLIWIFLTWRWLGSLRK